jgi:hypothetical protein
MFKTAKKLFIIGVIFLVVPFLASAVNDVVINGIVSFDLLTADTAAPTTILASAGGQVTNLDVQSNYIDIILDNLSDITFNATVGGEYLKITPASGANFTVTPACPTTIAQIQGTGATVTVRLEVTTIAPVCPGSRRTVDFPTNYSVVINNGAATTGTASVNLTLEAQDALWVTVSNNPNFIGAGWEPFTSPMTKSWALLSGDGIKTVYVIYKSITNDLSPIINDVIELKTTLPTPPTSPLPSGGGGACSIDCQKVTYDLYIVNPDGTIRNMNGSYARVTNLGNNVKLVGFEDSGKDMDFNDVIIKTDKSTCDKIIVTLISLDAAWAHQVKLKIFYSGILKNDLLIFANSKTAKAAGPSTTNLNNYPNICEVTTAVLNSGDLIKGTFDAVYYYGSDSKRHVFPNRGTYDSWYNGDFSKVKIISNTQLSLIALGYNMTYRPGVRMIKLQYDPRVYAVDENAVLRPIASESVAQALYGNNWNRYIDDLSDAFFINYTIGLPINSASDFPANSLPKNLSVNNQANVCFAPITFTLFMTLNDNNSEVLEMQKLLQCLGYFPSDISPNGNFGKTTENAVKKFQTDHGIEAVGYVGPATRTELNKY